VTASAAVLAPGLPACLPACLPAALLACCRYGAGMTMGNGRTLHPLPTLNGVVGHVTIPLTVDDHNS